MGVPLGFSFHTTFLLQVQYPRLLASVWSSKYWEKVSGSLWLGRCSIIFPSHLFTLSLIQYFILGRQWTNCACVTVQVETPKHRARSGFKVSFKAWFWFLALVFFLLTAFVKWSDSVALVHGHQYTSDVVVFLEVNLRPTVSYLVSKWYQNWKKGQVCSQVYVHV